ncbi:hypothetical protein BT93_I1677 [Corymbia citriodora subsp. variegata]|nr:hypothetical protein BT93_I1677 [Corymbia citriodora subsp. variegata]KAF8013885.1 hypothetical protein BT93_I1677 [Corymbia citriodora subsp. variegata]KAF8013886.1 hypothetical protein BT93_I1677 [Corymbia citriodora subsp. variegata]
MNSRRAGSSLVYLRPRLSRCFRSDAALEAIARARDERVPNLALYNYPSFSGAFSALFARLFHSRLHVPCLILPFSSVEPLRVEDLHIAGLEKCYLLDFLGPKGFAAKLAQQSLCKIIAFEHRKSAFSHTSAKEDCPDNLVIHFSTEKSSVTAVYEYFSAQLAENRSTNEGPGLLDPEDQERMEMVLKYIEDGDLRRWTLPDIRAFNIRLSERRSKLNCITNPLMYEQLLDISAVDLMAKGNAYTTARQISASKFLEKVFKVRLGRGLYGECLGIRADGISDLSDEIGKQLSVKSAASGLRPIGAVVYMQRNNLKMSLRSTDDATDTSEVAKAYGGGGTPASSSFIIRMDEYNHWLSVNPP